MNTISKKDCKNHGQYPIWLWGSRKTITRSVYEAQDGRCYIVWYGQMIEVKHGWIGYTTIEAY